MDFCADIILRELNTGLTLSLTFGALLLLRPLQNPNHKYQFMIPQRRIP